MDSRTDVKLLFFARGVRLFSYGAVSVILVLYLSRFGLRETDIGLLLSGTLVGDAAISLWITTSADRRGRRRMVQLGAALMVFSGVVFALTGNFLLLLVAATIGVISPSGNEIGPFLAIEQAGLAHLVPAGKRTLYLSWYTMTGSIATALGALTGGFISEAVQAHGVAVIDSYRIVLGLYVVSGLALLAAFTSLSPGVEVAQSREAPSVILGVHASRTVVLRLSALFALDAFAGGFILQSIIAFWFHVKFGVSEGMLGGILFGANVLAGVSSILAARLAARIGLIRTMVFTHVPSSVLLCLIPLMPTFPLAVLFLLLRYSISQMDVPTRQSYTLAVVSPDERSAASGVTNIARSVGASVSPALAGALLASPAFLSAPFVLAGSLKIVYDLLLYRSFSRLKAPGEEAEPPAGSSGPRVVRQP